MKLLWTLVAMLFVFSIVVVWMAAHYKTSYDRLNFDFAQYKNTSIALCDMFNYLGASANACTTILGNVTGAVFTNVSALNCGALQ